ncbi:MAG: hypothetical protein HZA16_09680 [Nitrospirae bacterium]|nr:hypothetical protein [Nitrospirota bacterium]
MTSCRHNTLVLLSGEKKRLRCRRCYLLIKAEELGENCCPECLEERGEKRYDFEEVRAAETDALRYRCEECGVIIESA